MRRWELAPNFDWEFILANKDLHRMVLQKDGFSKDLVDYLLAYNIPLCGFAKLQVSIFTFLINS